MVLAALFIGQTPPVGGGGDALRALVDDWASLKDVRSLEARFACEKELAALDTPLHSQGRLWIGRGDGKSSGEGIRFSTEKPYVSELILSGGKMYARSQHETDWTKTSQASRPGLTAVMGQLGGWSTGDTSQIAAMYSVTRGEAAIPSIPTSTGQTGKQEGAAEVFILTPSNPDLAKAVSKVTLALDQETHVLRYVEIVTQQQDVTRYWFFDVKRNVDLPNNIFRPGSELMVPGEGK